MSQSSKQKIFRQQMSRMATSVRTRPCPVCGRLFDEQATAGTGHGETIDVKTQWGWKTIPRFVDMVYAPCGCKETYDRRLRRAVTQEKGGS